MELIKVLDEMRRYHNEAAQQCLRVCKAKWWAVMGQQNISDFRHLIAWEMDLTEEKIWTY